MAKIKKIYKGGVEYEISGSEIDSVTVDYQEDGGSPDASAQFSDGELAFSLKNMKMKFSELTAAEKAEITGPQGGQGDSAVYDPSSPDTPDFVMANTTGQSTTKAMTQKAVTDAIDAVTDMVTESETFSSSDFTEQLCSLGTASYGWYRYRNTGPQRHVAMPVESGQIVRLTPTSENENGLLGFLTSSYSPPYKEVDPVPFVTGTDRIAVPAGQEASFVIPEGCAYLVLVTVDGADMVTSWEIEVMTSLKPHIAEIDEDIAQLKDDTTIDHILPTDAPLGNYIAVDTLKWFQASDWKGMVIDIADYRGMDIIFTKNPNGPCRYAFLYLDTTTKNTTPFFCQGETLKEVPSESSPLRREIPNDASYLYVYAYSSGNIVTPEIIIKEPLSDALTEKSFMKESDVDISSLTVQVCSLGVPTWYLVNSGPQAHVALQVTPGESYRLSQESPTNASGYYAFLTSSYSPPYTNGDAVPYVSGTSRIAVGHGTSTVITIPEGCAYLALNKVDGAGNSNNWVVEKGTAGRVIKDFGGDSPIKLRMAHWNIGHFALGTDYHSHITHEQYPMMRAKWSQAINDINADFMLMCEYSTNMVDAEGSEPAIPASEAIFNLYQYGYVGSLPEARSWMQTAIFGNHRLSNVTEGVYTDTDVVGRYYQVGNLKFGNKTVKVVETHLSWNMTEHSAADRASQIQQLITAFANDDYVIIAGDFNTNDGSSEFDAFTAAGYRMLNHGYLGDIPTCPAGSEPDEPIDNIVCKGFTINGIKVVNDDTLSDHCCIYADFTLIG